MYDYFFLEKKENLDNVEIEFTSGKDEFLLSSVHNKDENDKITIRNSMILNLKI